MHSLLAGEWFVGMWWLQVCLAVGTSLLCKKSGPFALGLEVASNRVISISAAGHCSCVIRIS